MSTKMHLKMGQSFKKDQKQQHQTLKKHANTNSVQQLMNAIDKN